MCSFKHRDGEEERTQKWVLGLVACRKREKERKGKRKRKRNSKKRIKKNIKKKWKKIVWNVGYIVKWYVVIDKRNAISTIFSQQILSGGLLLVIMDEQKSNLNCKFKLEPITTYHL